MSDNNNNFENDNTVVEVSGIDAGKLIERPIKPGYVFSHWSLIKPGSKHTVNRADGTTVEVENECPPFDFSKEVITRDITLYAVFIPEVTVTFKCDDEIVATQGLVYGGKAYNPTPNGLRSAIEEGTVSGVGLNSHNSHVGPKPNTNTGTPIYRN